MRAVVVVGAVVAVAGAEAVARAEAGAGAGAGGGAEAAGEPQPVAGLIAALNAGDAAQIDRAVRAFPFVIVLEEPALRGEFKFLKREAPRIVACTERARVGARLGVDAKFSADDAWFTEIYTRLRTSGLESLVTFRETPDGRASDTQWVASAWVKDGAFAGAILSSRTVGKQFPWALLVGIFAGALGFGAAVFLGRTLRRHATAYAFVAPTFLATAVLLLFPIGYGVGLAFMSGGPEGLDFTGFANFSAILGSGEFYATLGVTVLWTAVNVALHVAIGVALALALAAPWFRLRGVFRALLILPWAVPNYITAILWRGMFDYQSGVVNGFLSALGVDRVEWFSSFASAFTANVVTNTWLGFPFMMVMTLGALQSIPSDLYEAADVDGASRWAKFRSITLPLLGPALFPAVLMGSFWTFNMFNVIYLVSGGEPHGTTNILITEVYRWFKVHNRYGIAAAYAVIIFFVLVFWTIATNRLKRRVEAMV
ncbi:MAG: sugar ABC transporter permease [Deltaproteobacteria bacterium]|nr:sugar ABC transporter permease [Deltaproteobacteria bacterium]